jgi:hypothetical protein
VALTNDDTLYAVGQSAATGQTKGLFRIDRVTGQPTLIVPGGPGPAGSGLYESLAGGSDGKLYAVGSLDLGFTDFRLFRLDGSQWTAVAIVTGGGLPAGPSGAFFVVSGYSSVAGAGKLQLVDPVSGTSAVFATGTTATEFGSVGYNPTTGTIYVTDNGKIWAITKNSTPARTDSWGSVKAIYRK